MIIINSIKNIHAESLMTNQNMINDFYFWETSINGEDIGIYKKINNEIVGLICMSLNNNIYKTLYINVKKEYRNKGVAKELINYQLEYIKKNNFKLINSKYTKDGELKIKKYYIEAKIEELDDVL